MEVEKLIESTDPITYEELGKSVKNLKNRKAPGSYGINIII
jgi:hypothetical protein